MLKACKRDVLKIIGKHFFFFPILTLSAFLFFLCVNTQTGRAASAGSFHYSSKESSSSGIVTGVRSHTNHNAMIASERIRAFNSVVQILPDADLLVEETITVDAMGLEIKRGIYRDFPTLYQQGFRTLKVGFQVLSVKRDGVDIPYSITNQSNGKRVYMGAMNQYIQPGHYEYKLTYKTNRQIGFFEQYDELYWNVTGNGWSFPIDRATAYILLPKGATLVQKATYIGAQGSTDRTNVSFSQPDETSVAFSTQRTLNPREGLTVAVAWPKGFVTPASDHKYFFEDYGSLIAALLIWIAFLSYHIYLWFALNEDERKQVIIPIFSLPEGSSPASANFMMTEFLDRGSKAFVASLVSLAVQKFIKIYESEGSWIAKKRYVLKKLNRDDKPASDEENMIYEKLFRSQEEVELSNTYDPHFQDITTSFAECVKADYRPDYFKKSFGGAGSALTGVASCLGIALLGFHILLSLGITVPIVILFWIRNWYMPSAKGLEFQRQIEGFKLYLSVAEKNQLDRVTPPDLTPEVFEKNLPYAIALGVETEWGKKFQSLVDSGLYQDYEPTWCNGTSWRTNGFSSFFSDFSSSFSNAISASATPPGSSSGSGGGGSSGGGGGGGGGGGF